MLPICDPPHAPLRTHTLLTKLEIRHYSHQSACAHVDLATSSQINSVTDEGVTVQGRLCRGVPSNAKKASVPGKAAVTVDGFRSSLLGSSRGRP